MASCSWAVIKVASVPGNVGGLFSHTHTYVGSNSCHTMPWYGMVWYATLTHTRLVKVKSCVGHGLHIVVATYIGLEHARVCECV